MAPADVMQYQRDGYLPHALVNYLARLGWSHGDQEIFSVDELKSLFAINDVELQGSRLDPAKLGWLNQHYLKGDDPDEVGKHLVWHLEHAGYDLARVRRRATWCARCATACRR
jgi:glutamyl-tRNA synthetase